MSLPFFDADVYDPAGNAMPLYQRVLTPELPNVFFIGFVQTVGSNIPLMEMQSEWVGDLITGACLLAPEPEIRRWIAADQAAMSRRYVRSGRLLALRARSQPMPAQNVAGAPGTRGPAASRPHRAPFEGERVSGVGTHPMRGGDGRC